MSRQDLEEYWNKRDAFTSNPSIEASYNPEKMREMLDYKTKIEDELKSKDPRAFRAVKVSGQLSRGEAGHIVEELYPDERLRPVDAIITISTKAQRKMCMRLYDIFVDTAFDAASELAPL